MKANFFTTSLVLAFLCTGAAFSQLQSFDLSTYKNPYFKRSELDLGLNLNGSSQWDNTINNSFGNRNAIFGGNFNGTFSQTLNSPTEQRSWQFRLYDSPSFSKNKNAYVADTIKKKQLFLNRLNLGLNTTNRFYKSNRMFFEIALNSYFSNDYSNSKANNYNGTEDNIVSSASAISGFVRLAIGKGRVEEVEDARLAVYILDDLEKHNRLGHAPTDEEILEFSKVITQLKNKRFFDTRLSKIEEITAVDSFLTASSLAKSHDAAYFTTITDNWDNAAGPRRYAGFRYSVGVIPTLNYGWFKYTGQSVNQNRSLGAGVDLQLNYLKPVNLYWQLDGSFNVRYQFRRETNNNPFSPANNINQIYATAFGKLGFYPNSRSSYNLSLGIIYYKTYNKLTESQTNSNAQSINPTLAIDAYYYITQRLRLQANCTVYFYNMHYNNYIEYAQLTSNSLNQNFNIALTYSLF